MRPCRAQNTAALYHAWCNEPPYVRVKASRKAVLFNARNSKASHLTVNRALYRTSMIRIKSSMRPRTAIYTLYYKILFSRENSRKNYSTYARMYRVLFFFYLLYTYVIDTCRPQSRSKREEYSFFFFILICVFFFIGKERITYVKLFCTSRWRNIILQG